MVYKCFYRKFSRFFKISDSSRFDQSNLLFDWLKREKKKVLRLKISGFLDSSQLVGYVFKWFLIPVSIPPDQSKLVFFKTNRNQITCSSVFLSSSSIPLSIPSYFFFFFCLFLIQSFKGFLPQHKVRLFYPFFFIKLHAFMHFS